ncbi:DUF4173 domain-containing protein [Plantactinospora sp. B5E13]|uniref:DUF4153 domain-containing protein n=1 Tax=unclassified Plantactinospora TaxID=2631981 RepID=UPI00325E055B
MPAGNAPPGQRLPSGVWQPPAGGAPVPALAGPAVAAVRPPSVLRRRWPGPAAAATPGVLGTLAGAAGVAALSIPLTRTGLGWLVAGFAGTAALLTAAASSGGRPTDAAADGAPDTPERAGGATRRLGRLRRLGGARPLWALATLALLGVGTIRAAGWLFVLCLLTAGVTATLTVADGRSVRGLLFSGLIPPAAVIRALPWAARGLDGSGRPDGGGRIGRTVGTVVVSAVLLLVFGLLLSSADAAFARQLDQVLPDLSVPTVFRWIFLFVAVGAGLLGAAYVLTAPPDLTGLTIGSDRARLRRFDWMLPVALLDLLFAGFVAVQLTTLFGGDDHVLRTAGLTYAEYARGGFWQLLAVSVLTLLVIGAAAWWAPRNGRTDRVLIRLLLGALTLLSLVIVASALYRMDVYADAYGATRLRLLVAACELWIGLLFVLVAVAGIRLAGAWLPRLAIGTAVVALLGLAVANPDRLIAERNVELWRKTGRIDVWYLGQLSADAVPALDQLPEPLRGCALIPIAGDLVDRTDRYGSGDDRRHLADDWHEFNLGRAEARRILVEHPVPSVRASMSLPSARCG